MSPRVSTWALTGTLALAALTPASAQFASPLPMPSVRDYSGFIINGVVSPHRYLAPQMPSAWIIPNYVIHYEAPRPIILTLPAPERPAVGPVQVATVTLRDDTDPGDTRVKPGTVVTWHNAGAKDRTLVVNVSGQSRGRGPSVLREWLVQPSRSSSLVFNEPGVYEYHLQHDPEQRGRIIVEG